MAKARKILRRLRSIRNIHEVTRAMYMISTARFKRAHDMLAAARPYLRGVTEMAAEALRGRRAGEAPHPLLAGGEASAARGQDARDTHGPDAPPTVLLVIASRRGLCGSYNNAIAEHAAKRAEDLCRDGTRVLLRSSGRRGQLILDALGWPVERAYPQFDRSPDAAVVRGIADGLMQEFLRGAISGAEAAYMRFVSTGQQRPTVQKVLPLEVDAATPAGRTPAGRLRWEPGPVPPQFIPGREEVLSRLIPEAVRARLLECFLEASASEHVARMTAMRYASENADDLIHELTVRYNRARQSQITMELAEIMGGREGVEGL